MSEPQRHPCPCCGALTIDEIGHYDICNVCDWEDDPIQRDDPEYAGGANTTSLREARQRYREFSSIYPPKTTR